MTARKDEICMFGALGVVVLVGGAILMFATDRGAEGVDLVAVAWILTAGGGLALLVAMIRGAGVLSVHGGEVSTGRHLAHVGRHDGEETRMS